MEFLLTYGWAITVVVVAISALAYFGMLNWDKWFPPNRCELPAGLSCLDHRVYVFNGLVNKLEMNFKNNLGYKLRFKRIEVARYGLTGTDALDISYIPELPNGEATKVPNNIECTDITNVNNGGVLIDPGSKYDINFIFVYENTETGLEHSSPGRIIGIVQ